MIRQSFSLVSVILVMLSFATAGAQDVVVLNDGTEIQSQIVKVSENDSIVYYKNWIDLESPTDSVPFADVYQLLYEDGSTRTITDVYEATEEEKTATRIQLHRKKFHMSAYHTFGVSLMSDGCESTGSTFQAICYLEYFPSLYKQVFWAFGGGFSMSWLYGDGGLPNDEFSDGYYFLLTPECGWLYKNGYFRVGPKFEFLLAGSDYHNPFLFSISMAAGYKYKFFEVGAVFDYGFSNVYSCFPNSRKTISLALAVGLHF